jgi:hypothetical protein
MLLNIHNEESLRIRNTKFSSEWPFNINFAFNYKFGKFICEPKSTNVGLTK